MRLCTPYFFCGLILCVYLSNQCAAEEPTPMKLEKLYEEQTVSIEEDGHDVTFKAQGGTKASSGKRSIDNGNGDNKIVKSTVAEDADNVIAQAQNIIDGKTMSEIAAMEEPKSKNPHDARTREARSFLQRMAKRG